MILGVRGGEQVVGDTVALEDFQEAVVIFFVYFFDGHPGFIRGDGNGRAVRVRAADHQHLVSFQAVVARDDVTGQVRTGDVADVDFSIGIWPGDGDQDVFGHKSLHF